MGTALDSVVSVDCVDVVGSAVVDTGGDDSAAVVTGSGVETEAESDEQAAPTRAQPRRTTSDLRMGATLRPNTATLASRVGLRLLSRARRELLGSGGPDGLLRGELAAQYSHDELSVGEGGLDAGAEAYGRLDEPLVASVLPLVNRVFTGTGATQFGTEPNALFGELHRDVVLGDGRERARR